MSQPPRSVLSSPVVLALPGNEARARAIADALPGDVGTLTIRRFPDEESYIRVESAVAGCDVMLVCTLDRPDDKVLQVLFLAAALRELGAARVGLIAPYLAYMRQDRRFTAGEALTSVDFARLLSGAVDWLVTVDPHLHRRSSLAEIYTIPTRVIHAAPFMAAWIRANVSRPVLIGPDSESAQWVGAVAGSIDAPFTVLSKTRRGDRDVSVSIPDVDQWKTHTPVLVDDIISTARTMIETVGHLRRAGLAAPVCAGVHPVFAAGAYDALLAAGPERVVTCNTISHPSNGIDLSGELAATARTLLGQRV